MASEILKKLVSRAVADYGFRLVLTGSTEDIIRRFQLQGDEAAFLKSVVVPELKKLPNPVEPDQEDMLQARFSDILARH